MAPGLNPPKWSEVLVQIIVWKCFRKYSNVKSFTLWAFHKMNWMRIGIACRRTDPVYFYSFVPACNHFCFSTGRLARCSYEMTFSATDLSSFLMAQHTGFLRAFMYFWYSQLVEKSKTTCVNTFYYYLFVLFYFISHKHWTLMLISWGWGVGRV